uniref:Uncharacterized protein n=1 Tax=Amphimedon queenslandica TaxID=400682 RepID=A0A1X7SQQ0_AMPQE
KYGKKPKQCSGDRKQAFVDTASKHSDFFCDKCHLFLLALSFLVVKIVAQNHFFQRCYRLAHNTCQTDRYLISAMIESSPCPTLIYGISSKTDSITEGGSLCGDNTCISFLGRESKSC